MGMGRMVNQSVRPFDDDDGDGSHPIHIQNAPRANRFLWGFRLVTTKVSSNSTCDIGGWLLWLGATWGACRILGWAASNERRGCLQSDGSPIPTSARPVWMHGVKSKANRSVNQRTEGCINTCTHTQRAANASWGPVITWYLANRREGRRNAELSARQNATTGVLRWARKKPSFCCCRLHQSDRNLRNPSASKPSAPSPAHRTTAALIEVDPTHRLITDPTSPSTTQHSTHTGNPPPKNNAHPSSRQPPHTRSSLEQTPVPPWRRACSCSWPWP